MKRQAIVVSLVLFLGGCGTPLSQRVAKAYVEGTHGLYSCVIAQDLIPEPDAHVLVGVYKSAADADSFCKQVDALLKQAPRITPQP